MRSAHRTDPPGELPAGDELRTMGPRPDEQQRVGGRERVRGRSSGDHVDVRHERPCELGAPLDVAVDRADTDELDVGMRRRAQQRDRVVGIVADVGVDPAAHCQRASTARKPSSSVGFRNVKPVASRRVGLTR